MRTSHEIAVEYFEAHPEAKQRVIDCGLKMGLRAGRSVESAINVAAIIKSDEELYARTLQRCEKLIKSKYSDVTKLDGATLAMLHHTHGCDPTIIESILGIDLPSALHDDYQTEYLKHRQTGKRGQVVTPVVMQ